MLIISENLWETEKIKLKKTEGECIAPVADQARTKTRLRRQRVRVRSGTFRNYPEFKFFPFCFLNYIGLHQAQNR